MAAEILITAIVQDDQRMFEIGCIPSGSVELLEDFGDDDGNKLYVTDHDHEVSVVMGKPKDDVDKATKIGDLSVARVITKLDSGANMRIQIQDVAQSTSALIYVRNLGSEAINPLLN